MSFKKIQIDVNQQIGVKVLPKHMAASKLQGRIINVSRINKMNSHSDKNQIPNFTKNITTKKQMVNISMQYFFSLYPYLFNFNRWLRYQCSIFFRYTLIYLISLYLTIPLTRCVFVNNINFTININSSIHFIHFLNNTHIILK